MSILDENKMKVAAIQCDSKLGFVDQNLEEQVQLIQEAANRGAKLIVLPELCNTGYNFESRAEVIELAEKVPDGKSSRLWGKLAKDLSIYIVAGVTENDEGKFYNSAVFMGPDGYIGKYRKIHLWDRDKLFFEPGNLDLPIFNLPFGRVGLMICYDGWHPEVTRIYGLRGADIVCDPSCWVCVPDIITAENPISAYLHMANAHFNSLYLICADRHGEERGITYLGNSCIAGPEGFVGGPASLNKTEVLVAEIDLLRSRYKSFTDLAVPLRDRRIDVFAKYLLTSEHFSI